MNRIGKGRVWPTGRPKRIIIMIKRRKSLCLIGILKIKNARNFSNKNFQGNKKNSPNNHNNQKSKESANNHGNYTKIFE